MVESKLASSMAMLTVRAPVEMEVEEGRHTAVLGAWASLVDDLAEGLEAF